MRSVFGVAIVAAALLVSGTALAAKPHYTYVELGLQQVDLDEAEFDSGTGWDLGGQWGNEVFHIFGRYGQFSNDFSWETTLPTAQTISITSGSLDTTQTTLGFGIHGLLGEKGDLLGEAGYMYHKGDYGDGYDESSDGLFFGGGIRYMIMDFLELKGMIYNFNMTDIDSMQSFNVDIVGYIGKLGIGGGYAYENLKFEGADEYQNPGIFRLYVRWNLGPN